MDDLDIIKNIVRTWDPIRTQGRIRDIRDHYTSSESIQRVTLWNQAMDEIKYPAELKVEIIKTLI